MAHVVVLGAGLGGVIMAYELHDKLGNEHQVSVVSKSSTRRCATPRCVIGCG